MTTEVEQEGSLKHFNVKELVNLLKCYYSSQLKSHDNNSKMRSLKPIILDPNEIKGVTLNAHVTHNQLSAIMLIISKKKVRRQNQSIIGWHEYCLKTIIGFEREDHYRNSLMPKVRNQDMRKSLEILSDLIYNELM